jgi:hypothetical protein
MEFDMFVQVVQGRVSDAQQVKAHIDTWNDEVAPGAEGYLGSTGGVTDDGQLIALVRFESEEAAQRNSDRPEQSAWWDGMAALFTDEPVFHNSTSVDVDTPGDPDQAGFVQVMQGRTSDPDRARELMASDPTDMATFRPDVLGSLSVNHDSDGWTMAIYFTSEAEAREGEQKEMPAEMQAIMEELNSLSIGEISYFDLKDPWLRSPA